MTRVAFGLGLGLAARLVLVSPCAAGSTAMLAADVGLDGQAGLGSDPDEFLPLGSRLLFSADTARGAFQARELWASDGSAAGTLRLSEQVAFSRWLGELDGAALFSAATVGAEQLWRTDGSPEGTVPLVDAELSVRSPLFEIPGASLFTAVHRAGSEPRHPVEQPSIWQTDGTPAGTRMLLELPIGFVQEPALAGGTLFFVFVPDTDLESAGPDGEAVRELWRLDVRGGEARRLRQLGPLEVLGSGVLDGRYLVFGNPTSGGRGELWQSDGSPAGTRRVTRLPAGESFGAGAQTIGARLLFSSRDRDQRLRLWATDGTADGTRQLSPATLEWDLHLSPLTALPHRPGSFLFAANEPGTGTEPWVSNGRAQGTDLLMDLCPGECHGIVRSDFVGERPGDAGVLFFTGADTPTRRSVWSTDGTSAGTRFLTELSDGPPSCPLFFSSELVTIADELYFFRCSATHGLELMRAGIEPSSVRRLSRLPDHEGLGPEGEELSLALLGDTLLFAAFDPVHGRELWASDGAPATTRLVTDLRPGVGSSSQPRGIVELAGRALFLACRGDDLHLFTSEGDPDAVTELADVLSPCNLPFSDGPPASVVHGLGYFALPSGLWRSDGSPAGTFRLLDHGGGPEERLFPFAPVALGARAAFGVEVFQPELGTHGVRLWETDGSVTGTLPLEPMPALEGLVSYTSLGEHILFIANEGQHPRPGITDGTAAGTRFLPIPAQDPFQLHNQAHLVPFGAAAFVCCFPFGDEANSAGAWFTDGTDAGTLAMSVSNAFPSDLVIFPDQFATLPDGSLLFHNRAAGLDSLWRTDGTLGGTRQVAPISSPARTGAFRRLGDHIAFFTNGQAGDTRLWTSDGTAAGTVAVWLAPAAALSVDIEELHSTGDRLFFSATDAAHGAEPWTSDGTAAGTRLAHDLLPGTGSSQSSLFTRVGSRLFFRADDGLVGGELWTIGGAPGGDCANGTRSLCLGGRYRAEARWQRADGASGHGHAASVEGDSGAFWFFNGANYDLLVKVLDGAGINGNGWVFAGGLSDVAYQLTVTDTETGETVRYLNLLGQSISFGDTAAFSSQGHEALVRLGDDLGFAPSAPPRRASFRSLSPPGACASGPDRLCLLGARFELRAEHELAPGFFAPANTIDGTDGTGLFWFRRPGNLELGVKMLDGLAINGRFWIFAATLTDQAFRIIVTDTLTGSQRIYEGLGGSFASFADTSAF